MREDLIGISGPTLHRLMALRDALVALKGPLADNPALCERLHKRLFDDNSNEPTPVNLRFAEQAPLD